MTFYDLPPLGRTLLAMVFFLSFCFSVCLTVISCRKKHRLSWFLLPLGAVVSGGVEVLYSAALRVTRMGQTVSAFSHAFCQLPVVIPILLLLAILFCHGFALYKEFQYRKTTLTRSAIKEGIDQISSGFCFYYENGRVVLSNRSMNALCYALTGESLQNAALFWETLKSGDTEDGAERLNEGENPTFRFSDGSVWTFSCEKLSGIFQLAASEISDLQAITDELEEKNKQLTVLNQRLRKYGETVDALTHSKERLEIKVRLHRELGQALLASRRFLLDDGEALPPCDRWQGIVAMLRKEAEEPTEEPPMSMLRRAVKATGIELFMEGELPEAQWLQKAFVQAAAEALTNAISHAEAKSLFIRLSQNEQGHTAEIRNDGIQPDGPIVEGGGLGSLRKKIEGMGGKMTVSHEPEFVLAVTLPKERGDLL